MEDEKKKNEFEKKESEIIYSNAIKAGRRIYYLDVKKSRKGDLYLAITESKKKVTGYDDNVQVSYEKHKIFLYQEDFGKFTEGMEDVIGFIKREQGEPTPRPEYIPNLEEKKDADNQSTTADEKDDVQQESEPKKSFFDKFKF